MLFGSVGAYAQPIENAEQLANGYIVKVKDDPYTLASLEEQGLAPTEQGLLHLESEEALERLGSSCEIEYYEPNFAAKLTWSPVDEYYSYQWNLDDIRVNAAWDAGYFGQGIVVAVIDTGIYAQHEDFTGTTILNGMNLIQGNSDVTDRIGHGTLVSGIIAAQIDNDIGISGLTDEVSILPLRCFEDVDEASVMDICRGIYKAVDSYGADVICMSLGSAWDSRTMRDAVDYAVSKGVILVAAVGNDGTSDYFYPAAYESVIGVGSYDKNGTASSFSQVNDSVFISAPGEKIYSTYIGKPNAYAAADGTSFSAPHVAAAAAIAKSIEPNMTAEAFKQLLIETCDDVGEPGYDTLYGYGKLNIEKMVEQLLSGRPMFSDTEGHWAADYIDFCVKNGLLSGVGNAVFSPDTVMTRGMAVTVLYRLDNGRHTAEFNGTPFSDVTDPNAWYYDAVYWAAANGIVNGMGDGSFSFDAPITRQQFATMLYRYTGTPEVNSEGSLAAFVDSVDISDYSVSAIAWCCEQGIMGGDENGLLHPTAQTTRAQAAKMIAQYSTLDPLTPPVSEPPVETPFEQAS